MISSKDFPYSIIIPKINHHKALVWCTKKFGPRFSVVDNQDGVWSTFWAGRSIPRSYIWHFKNEKDYLVFSLKWM